MERFAMRPPEQDKKYNFPVGAVRSGKTWGLHSKILYLCDYPVEGRKLITGASKDTIQTNVLTDLFQIVGSSHYHYNRQSGDLNLFGSEWKVMGAKDEGSEKFIRGATVGAAVCDEVTLMPMNFFQMLLTRLSPPGARLYGSTNTDSPYHWLYKDYLTNSELADLLWWDTFTMDDNPNLDPSYIEEQKRLYAGVFYKRMILGQWVVAGGAVYGDSWSNDNLYDDKSRPVGLYGQGGYSDHIIGVDYGTANACVFLDGIDDGRTVWIDNEYYWDSRKMMQQKTDQEYGDDFEKFVKESNCSQPPKVVVDPSAASFKAELQKRGYWVVNANNDVNDGIRRTSSALHQKKIRFHRKRCSMSQKEMPAYSWDEKKSQHGTEEPIKSNDHSCDAVRYLSNDVFVDWRLAA
jgi:PBSX family phage terminase large subunit